MRVVHIGWAIRLLHCRVYDNANQKLGLGGFIVVLAGGTIMYIDTIFAIEPTLQHQAHWAQWMSS